MRQVLQEQKPVFVALGVANMHPPAIGIDIRRGQTQAFAQAQPHAVQGKKTRLDN